MKGHILVQDLNDKSSMGYKHQDKEPTTTSQVLVQYDETRRQALRLHH